MNTSKLIIASSIFGLYHVHRKKVHAEVFSKPDLDLLENVDTSANEKSARKLQEEARHKVIQQAKNMVWIKMTESAVPGLVIAVSVDGKTVFRHGNLDDNDPISINPSSMSFEVICRLSGMPRKMPRFELMQNILYLCKKLEQC